MIPWRGRLLAYLPACQSICLSVMRATVLEGNGADMMYCFILGPPKALRMARVVEKFHSFFMYTTHLPANGMNYHSFAFPYKAGPHFTDPRGVEG